MIGCKARFVIVGVAVILISALATIQFQHGLVIVAMLPISQTEAEAKVVDAYLAIYEADIAGAEEVKLRDLSSKLNGALNMTREAQDLERQGRSAEASNLLGRATVACDETIAQARLLREEASRQSFYNRVIAFALAPTLALLTTVGLHFGYRWWRRREIEQIFRMEIRLKEKSQE